MYREIGGDGRGEGVGKGMGMEEERRGERGMEGERVCGKGWKWKGKGEWEGRDVWKGVGMKGERGIREMEGRRKWLVGRQGER